MRAGGEDFPDGQVSPTMLRLREPEDLQTGEHIGHAGQKDSWHCGDVELRPSSGGVALLTDMPDMFF